MDKISLNKKFNNYILMAKDFYLKGNLDMSLQSFKRALNFSCSKEESLSTLYEIAGIYLQLEDYSNASDNFKQILRVDKNQEGAYYGLAISNDARGKDPKTSIALYKKAIDLDADYQEAWYYLALSYDKICKKGDAIACLKKAISLNTKDHIALNDLASIYEEMGDYKTAEKYCGMSLKLKNDYGRALYNMGVILKKQGLLDEAEKYYLRAEKHFDESLVYLNLSALYIEEDNFLKSIQALDRGIKRYPHDEKLWYNRACSKCRLGLKGAEEDLLMAFDLNPEALIWAEDDKDLVDIVGVTYDYYKNRRRN